MEEKVPWWRRALEFALSGIRLGFALFRRSGELETNEPGNPGSEDAEAEDRLVETYADIVALAGGAEHENGRIEASAECGAEAENGKVGSGKEVGAEVYCAGPEAAGGGPEELKDLEGPEEEFALKKTSPQVEEVGAEAKLAEEPVDEPAAKAGASPAPTSQAEPNAPRAKAIAPQQAVPSLPVDTAPAAEPTKAERVAAAIKTRSEEAEQSPFSVMVTEVYDGPLDLLLDLIRKQDIDIYDIPIAKITAQFLEYVDRLRASDMDVAGEFIYTAALLIHIKSRMLLPRAPAGLEEAAEDPRRELVERLLEHERFKNAAQMLHEKQILEAATWTNPGVREFREDAGAEAEIAADTTDLVSVFRDVLERARNRPILDLEEDAVTVDQMIQFLSRRLTMEDKPVALRRLLSHTRSERALIALFLALLEMVRLQAILLRQDRQFSEIFIKKSSDFDAVMNQGLADARDDWR